MAAPTFADVRDTCAEGESGLIKILTEYGMLQDYNRSLGEVMLLNGSRVKLISGEEPSRFRGPQFHGGWIDELAAFNRPESFDQARIVLRLPGEKPQLVITTTPRPTDLVRNLLDAEGVIVSKGKTTDNLANLSEGYIRDLEAMYGGTRMWRQEIEGELLEDVPGALWTLESIVVGELPEMKRVVVAVDPAVTNTENSDETGIVVAGKALDNSLWVLADYTCKDSPLGWAKRAIEAYRAHNADSIVYEANQGGDAIADVFRSVDPYIPLKPVTARVGKRLRAEPIASLYEQGKVFHAQRLDRLVDQMVTWAADDPKSPDRLDAMVHALTELAGQTSGTRFLLELADVCQECQMINPKGSHVCSGCGAQLTTVDAPTAHNLWGDINGAIRS